MFTYTGEIVISPPLTWQDLNAEKLPDAQRRALSQQTILGYSDTHDHAVKLKIDKVEVEHEEGVLLRFTSNRIVPISKQPINGGDALGFVRIIRQMFPDRELTGYIELTETKAPYRKSRVMVTDEGVKAIYPTITWEI